MIPSANGMGTIAGENITATLQHDDNVTTNLLLHRFPVVDSTASGIQLFGTEGRMIWRSPRDLVAPTRRTSSPTRSTAIGRRSKKRRPDHYDPNGPANLDDYWFAEEWVRALDEGRDHEASGIEGRARHGDYDGRVRVRRLRPRASTSRRPSATIRWSAGDANTASAIPPRCPAPTTTGSPPKTTASAAEEWRVVRGLVTRLPTAGS